MKRNQQSKNELPLMGSKKKPRCFGKMDVAVYLPCAFCKVQDECFKATFGDLLNEKNETK